MEDVQKAIDQEGPPVVFRYHASWCRACKSFQPKWEELATQYGPSYRFLDVDITGNKDIVKAQQLTVLPHIHMYKGGKQIENFSVSVKKVPTLVEKLDLHKKA
jgi:thioredoxin-like negative regulator of GroEL